ncbi:MAG: AraC family transcriptional regulator [Acetobacteraceae bacterium]
MLAELGHDVAGLATEAGLESSVLDDPDAMIPFSEAANLLHLSRECSGCNHLGLLVGQRNSHRQLGVVGQLMENAPTLGAALCDLSLHQYRYARGASIYIIREGNVAHLGYGIYQAQAPAVDVILDLVTAIGLNIIRELTGSSDPPLRVLISRRQPEDPRPYRRFFGAPVEFDADRTGLLFPVEWLGRAIPGADLDKRQVLLAQVNALWSAGQPDLVSRLRHILRARMVTGFISGDHLADALSMNRRTFNRRLRSLGITYREILDEVRFEVARQMLCYTDMEIGTVAQVTQYADAANFTRAFQRWSGLTPSQWRQNEMAPDEERERAGVASTVLAHRVDGVGDQGASGSPGIKHSRG